MKKILLSILILLCFSSISYADFIYSFREGNGIYTFYNHNRNYTQRPIIIVPVYQTPIYGYPQPYYNYYGYPPIYQNYYTHPYMNH